MPRCGRVCAPLLAIALVCAPGPTIHAAPEPPEPSSDSAISAPAAPEQPYFFYRGYDYGSEALVHPLRLIINGGYGVLQLENRDNRVWHIDYRNGTSNLWKNLKDPGAAIRVGGWKDFLEREVLPISINVKSAQYYPNYTQHLIGGGMSYRLMSEWYRYHGFSHPQAWSVATLSFYHVLNEVVENDTYVGYTTDPIADLYIFDPLSMLLFSSDGVCGFFSRTLHMADWSYQPSYDPYHHTLENNGQNFALKYDLPGLEHWSLFNHFGTHSELGLAYTKANGDCFSFGLGLKAGQQVESGSPGVKTVTLAPAMGLFYDRNNSLMAALILARTKDYSVRLNLYPGLIQVGSLAPGFFVGVNRNEQVLAGVTIGKIRNLPFGSAARF